MIRKRKKMVNPQRRERKDGLRQHICIHICKGNLKSRTIERDHQVEEGSAVLGAQTRRMGSFLETAKRKESDVPQKHHAKGLRSKQN